MIGMQKLQSNNGDKDEGIYVSKPIQQFSATLKCLLSEALWMLKEAWNISSANFYETHKDN